MAFRERSAFGGSREAGRDRVGRSGAGVWFAGDGRFWQRLLLRAPPDDGPCRGMDAEEQRIPFEVIGNRHSVGPPVRFGGPFFIDGPHLRVRHGRLGIGVRLFEALAMLLLRRAPLHPGHIRAPRYDGFPARGHAIYQFAQLAADAFERGIHKYLRHCACFLPGRSRMLPGRSQGAPKVFPRCSQGAPYNTV